MAEDGQVTPEKQLLKLIEGSKDGQPAVAGGAPAKPKGAGLLSFGSMRGTLFGRFSFFKRSAKKKIASTPKFKISFVFVNRVLAAAAFALAVYVVTDIVSSSMNLNRPFNFSIQKEKSAGGAQKVSPLKESAYYVQKATARDLFKEGSNKPVEKKEDKKQAATVDSNPATSGLSLVGISWSANPDVIIEDKTTKRTFFVKRGQAVGEGVKVEAIFKDHVVLSFEGQEFELR